MNDLLGKLILVDRRLIKLSAELINKPDDQIELKTQIHFQLTPQAMRPGDKPLWPVRASIRCHGTNAVSATQVKDVYLANCILQLSYQQVVGPTLSLEQVKQSHMSLSRQAYPILIDKCQPLIQQLGLMQVRLPMDMLQVASQSGAGPTDALH